jgi:hypothetical protein
MKMAILLGLVSALILSGAALATQVEDEKKAPSMHGMMQEMMKGESAGESHMEGMMGMMGQMTKMMDQCASMMESNQTETQENKQDRQK